MAHGGREPPSPRSIVFAVVLVGHFFKTSFFHAKQIAKQHVKQIAKQHAKREAKQHAKQGTKYIAKQDAKRGAKRYKSYHPVL